MKNIYFDNAATTPLLPEVLEIIRKTLVNNYGNPSSIHKDGIAARSIIEENRRIISTSLNCSTSNIIFTASGTEAVSYTHLAPYENAGNPSNKSRLYPISIESKLLL